MEELPERRTRLRRNSRFSAQSRSAFLHVQGFRRIIDVFKASSTLAALAMLFFGSSQRSTLSSRHVPCQYQLFQKGWRISLPQRHGSRDPSHSRKVMLYILLCI